MITGFSILLAFIFCKSCSFALIQPRMTTLHGTRLFLSSFSSRDEEALSRARNDDRTDVQNLLTQRAIQSFCFLLDNCRDPHSVKWIEDFLGTRNQLNYHGTGAGYIERFGGKWDIPLLKMLEHPKDHVIVSAKRRGRGHGGWSKNNPYLPERWVEFKIDIDPSYLTTRIVSVREQIATEWITDLDILKEANQMILISYFDIVKRDRESASKNEDNIPISNDYIKNSEVAFERTATNIFQNNTVFGEIIASSPSRRANFDLLYNLCTQESIHRLLRILADGRSKQAETSFAWLREYYCDRVEEFFDGDLSYGRADDFIEELLLTSPSVIMEKKSGKVIGLADPLGLAEQIIEIRHYVCNEWKETMMQVPEAHTEIRKALFEQQVGSKGEMGSSEGFE